MKTPTPRKLSSGKWFIQMRLAGQSITVSHFDKKACTREAQAIKAEYLAGKREIAAEQPTKLPTLSEAIDAYIAERSNTVSPLTIRGYRTIQKHRFQDTMSRPLDEIGEDEWQGIINREAALCSAKTLKNAYGLIGSVYRFAMKKDLPVVQLPQIIPADVQFLDPDQIKIFVSAVKDTRYAVPALLALSSLRISEIQALNWKDIPKQPDFIRVKGAVVFDEHNRYQKKEQNKNASSTRNVPILIPELKAALERDRKPHGPVLEIHQNSLRTAVHKICKENGLPDVGVHGLRHSFASLAYHLQIPEEIAMDIGGWADFTTMRKIYTHISRKDINRYQNAMAEFYNPPNAKEENANKNANNEKVP